MRGFNFNSNFRNTHMTNFPSKNFLSNDLRKTDLLIATGIYMNFPESLNTDYTSLNITLLAASHVIPLKRFIFYKKKKW